MVDSLLGLRHDVIVGCHNDDGNIRHLGTTGTHGGKCFVTRRIKERNLTSVFQRHVISTDVLRNTARFTGNHIRLTDIVEQRCLTMVYVTHHGYNRSTRFQIFLCILFFHDGLCHFRTYIFRLKAEFFSHQINGLGIQTLVNGHHDTDAHAGTDDLRNGYVHHIGQLVGCHKLCQLQYFAISHFLTFKLMHTVGSLFTFLLAVFGSFTLAFRCEACQSFFHLFSNIFLTDFLFDNRFLETILIFLAPLLLSGGISTLLMVAFLIAGSVVDIYFLLVDTNAFLFTTAFTVIFIPHLAVFTTDFFHDGFFHLTSLVKALFFLLFAFFTLFFLRLLFGASRLIQSSKVYLTDNVNFRNKLRFANCKDLLRAISRLCFFNWSFLFFFHLHVCCFIRMVFLFSHILSLRFFHRRFACFLFHGFLNRLYFRNFFSNLCLNLFRRHLFNFRLRLNWLYNRFWFLLFHFFFFLNHRFLTQIIQINLAYRFKLRTYIFGNYSFNFLHLFLHGFLRFIAFDSHRRFVAFFGLTFLQEALGLHFKILVCTEFFFQQLKLFIGNFRIRICLYDKTLFL